MTGNPMANLLVATVAVATSSTGQRNHADATGVQDDRFRCGISSGFIEKKGQMGGVDGVDDAELLSPQASDPSQN
uniref:Secreted protein n=1 Tax=Romanomermis culicivorax TaxID=13658 RepID=A0A915JLG2_ROMCU